MERSVLKVLFFESFITAVRRCSQSPHRPQTLQESDGSKSTRHGERNRCKSTLLPIPCSSSALRVWHGRLVHRHRRPMCTPGQRVMHRGRSPPRFSRMYRRKSTQQLYCDSSGEQCGADGQASSGGSSGSGDAQSGEDIGYGGDMGVGGPPLVVELEPEENLDGSRL